MGNSLGVKVAPKSIIIVDDNAMIRRTLRNLFQEDGEWVICAEAVDGRDAVEKAQEFSPDMIVLDLCMPGMDGLEAASKLRNIVSKSLIVMLTAFKSPHLEDHAHKAGVSLVLAKEDSPKVLDFARLLKSRPNEASMAE
jgi:CheY-like chemotaxis protein